MSDQITKQPIDAKLLSSQYSGSRSFGPLTLTYNVDLTQAQASISASLLGVAIGTRVLNLNTIEPVNMEGNVSLFQTRIELAANPSQKIVSYNIVVLYFAKKVAGGQGVLFDW